MVNITHKSSTLRKAIALAEVQVSLPATIAAVVNKTVPKGDVFEFSRAAGLLACKKTYEVIPDCHPLPVEYTSITYQVAAQKIIIRVEVHTVYKTGVEVEAMHGAAITALTMYDMLKPIDPAVEISCIRLEKKEGGKTDIKHAHAASLKVGVVTCSDSVVAGTQQDISGQLAVELLQKNGLTTAAHWAVADDAAQIQAIAKQCMADDFDMVLFTGGTGLGPRDVTPDAIAPLIDKQVPGIMEAARNYGHQRTPYAMLSRGIAGFAANTLLLTLPGSPKGVQETMDALFPYLLHVFKMRAGERH